MKTIKNTNSFYVLGVKFENIQEAIEYAIKGLDKNGVFVGHDTELYPCFDSEDYASEDRFFWNIVFARSKEELDRKLIELKSVSPQTNRLHRMNNVRLFVRLRRNVSKCKFQRLIISLII